MKKLGVILTCSACLMVLTASVGHAAEKKLIQLGYFDPDPDYFVSDMTVRQYLSTNEIYGADYQRMYEDIDRRYPVAAEFGPTDDGSPLPYHSSHVNAPAVCLWRVSRPGPRIRVYEVASPVPKPLPEVALLQRPLDRTDWQYIARVGNFPLGMLTTEWMGDGPTRAMVRSEMARLMRECHGR